MMHHITSLASNELVACVRAVKRKRRRLVREGKTRHTRLNSQNIIAKRKQRKVRGRRAGGGGVLQRNGNLRIINARKITAPARLMLLGLKCEGVRVDTRHRGAAPVLRRLDGVEVSTIHRLHAVLAVQD